MAETREQQEQRREVGRRARERSEARQMRDAAAESGHEAVRAGEHTMRQGAHFMEEVAQRGAEGMGEAARRGVEATQQSMREFSEGPAGEDFRRLLTLPGMAANTLQQMQQAMTNLASRAWQAHIRAGQEVYRYVSPAAALELNRRVAQRYLRDMVESSAEFLRISRHLSDEALRPIEDGHSGGGPKIGDVMTPTVEIVEPDQSVQQAAKLMAESDTGALPVGENDRLVGMITDRDIALRVAAQGKDPQQTRVREVMTPDIRYVFEDEDVEHVAENMAEQQIRRLPVMNRDKRLVGIVSIGDISARHSPELGGSALRGVAEPGWSRQAQPAYAGGKPQSGQED